MLEALPKQEIADQRVEVSDRHQRRMQSIASHAGQTLHQDRIGGVQSAMNVLDLLAQDQVEEDPVRRNELIEIALGAEPERLDTDQACERRPLDHAMANGEHAGVRFLWRGTTSALFLLPS